MRISVSEAKGQLTELVKRAEVGDEVILTRRGHDVARLVPIVVARDAASRRSLMEKVRALCVHEGQPRSERGAQPGLPLWRRWPAGMIAVDTSALMAILLDEPESDDCMAAIQLLTIPRMVTTLS